MDKFNNLIETFNKENDPVKLINIIEDIYQYYNVFKLQDLFCENKNKLLELFKKITYKNMKIRHFYNFDKFKNYEIRSWLAYERLNYAIINNVNEICKDSNFIKMEYKFMPNEIKELLDQWNPNFQ